jgi:FKBP-type peptidyl-prolyl cis-trans isomerase SlyD
MEVAKHRVVSIDYVLRDSDGNIIDSSRSADAFSYVHGIGATLPALEGALEGKSAGDKLTLSLSPGRAYGERDESLVRVVPRNRFDVDGDIEVGMRFNAAADSGTSAVTVVRVEGDEVTVDGNHPLAGVTLNFAVTVVGVREATDEELAHGHVHGPGAPHH